MTKYAPLKAFLSHTASAEVPMRFSEIEQVIGARLPPVAFKHRAWWSNNPSNSVITHAWLEAGYKTERVDMGAQRLVFRRAEGSRSQGESTPARRSALPTEGVLAALRRNLGGTVRIPTGVDLTAPIGEPWDAETQ
jgi:hypothetical protein